MKKRSPILTSVLGIAAENREAWLHELKANSPVVAQRIKGTQVHPTQAATSRGASTSSTIRVAATSVSGGDRPARSMTDAAGIAAASVSGRSLPPPLPASSPMHISVYFKSEPHLLHVEYPDLRLFDATGKCKVHWPLPLLRSYGQTGQEFLLEAGRRCPQGEGLYKFFVAFNVNAAEFIDKSIEAHVRGLSLLFFWSHTLNYSELAAYPHVFGIDRPKRRRGLLFVQLLHRCRQNYQRPLLAIREDGLTIRR
jgi:hypothetical protein